MRKIGAIKETLAVSDIMDTVKVLHKHDKDNMYCIIVCELTLKY